MKNTLFLDPLRLCISKCNQLISSLLSNSQQLKGIISKTCVHSLAFARKKVNEQSQEKLALISLGVIFASVTLLCHQYRKIRKLFHENKRLKGELSQQMIKKPFPNISLKSYLVAKFDESYEIVCQNAMHQQFQPASLTKIVTLLIFLKEIEKDPEIISDTITVSQYAASIKNGTHADLRDGETITVKDMLYAMMLPSGNDAAAALAEYYGKKNQPPQLISDKQANLDESRTKVISQLEIQKEESLRYINIFLNQMNELCELIGAKDSKFYNPHGMFQKDMHSSAYDMLLFIKECFKYPLFAEIISTLNYKCIAKGRLREYPKEFYNTNSLLQFKIYNYQGIKTGYIPNAHGQRIHGNLATLVEHNNQKLIIITFGSQNKELRFLDTHVLAQYCFEYLLKA